YGPQARTFFRIRDDDDLVDVMRVATASQICGSSILFSGSKLILKQLDGIAKLQPFHEWTHESEAEFIARLAQAQHPRLRMLNPPLDALLEACAEHSVSLLIAPVLANGRLELLNYVREVSVSVDYHRYGNLGMREAEQRRPLKKGGCSKKSDCKSTKCCAG
ncbi:hypothetical protein SCG7086_DR_00010, partial [Chlamydiales bacterium SCGC AG-110-P3]